MLPPLRGAAHGASPALQGHLQQNESMTRFSRVYLGGVDAGVDCLGQTRAKQAVR